MPVTRMPDATGGPAPAVRLEAGRLEVVFLRTGDRWGHRVLVDGAPRFVSEEGPTATGDDRWPVSPVLTEVALVAAAGGPAVVGVGRAGRSHFSLSITRHPTIPDAVVVEAACRIHEPPGWLGSTYRPPEAPPAAAPASATPAGGTPGEGLIRVPAPPGATAPLPRTVTWSYLISPAGITARPPGAGAAGAPER